MNILPPPPPMNNNIPPIPQPAQTNNPSMPAPPPTSAPGIAMGKTASPNTIFIIIGAISAVLLLALAVFFIKSKDQTAETLPDQSEASIFGLGAKTGEEKTSVPTADSVTKTASDNSKCDSVYDAIISKYGKTYDDCYGTVKAASCDGRDPDKKNNLILILDSSGSMAAKMGGDSKLEIAKKAALNFVKNLADDVSLSIIAYGQKGSNSTSDKAVSCAGIEQVYWLDKVKSDVVNEKISPLQPTGWTPIADSLQKAKDILDKYPATEYNNSILLISDGEETCGGDPVAKAKELNASNINFKIDVIGFDVGGTAEGQLKAISSNGGGVYYSARNSQELNDNMNKNICAFRKNFANATSSISVTSHETDCLIKLSNEWTGVTWALGYRGEVEDDCKDYVSKKYDERYKDIKNNIEAIYNEGRDKIDQTK
jgi:Ca-activated chloride channel homolog